MSGAARRHLAAVSGAQDHTARVWDLATGSSLHVLTGHVNDVVVLVPAFDGDIRVTRFTG